MTKNGVLLLALCVMQCGAMGYCFDSREDTSTYEERIKKIQDPEYEGTSGIFYSRCLFCYKEFCHANAEKSTHIRQKHRRCKNCWFGFTTSKANNKQNPEQNSYDDCHSLDSAGNHYCIFCKKYIWFKRDSYGGLKREFEQHLRECHDRCERCLAVVVVKDQSKHWRKWHTLHSGWGRGID